MEPRSSTHTLVYNQFGWKRATGPGVQSGAPRGTRRGLRSRGARR